MIRFATVRRQFLAIVDAFDAAVSASAAIESGRTPSNRVLGRLGIAPGAFDRTRF